MADLAVWQRTIVDEEGNVVPGAEVEVRREEDGSLATLYADRAGETPLANPLAADMSGFVRFFAQGDAYTITAVGAGSTRTWRFDAVGTAAERDVEDFDPAGAAGAALSQARTEINQSIAALGSAAHHDASDFDPAGSSANAKSQAVAEAKVYTDQGVAQAKAYTDQHVAQAQDDANRAEVAADRAEAARDAAQLSAGVYPSAAAGLAATSNGDYFSVPISSGSNSLILYRNVSGAAEEAAQFPSIVGVQELVGEGYVKRGRPSVTNISTIRSPGMYFLSPASDFSPLPEDVDPAQAYWLLVHNPGNTVGTLLGRFTYHELVAFNPDEAWPARPRWSRRVDNQAPDVVTGHSRWVREGSVVPELLTQRWRAKGSLGIGDDLNDVIDDGLYIITSEVDNAPPGAMVGALLNVRVFGSYASQTYHALQNANDGWTRIIRPGNQIYYDWIRIGGENAGAPLAGKTVVCFGDSITEGQAGNSWVNIFAQRTGANAINAGFGGCRMAQHAGTSVSHLYDPMCMYRLSERVANGDWQVLIDAAQDLYDEEGDDNRPQAAALASLDWSTVDYVVIAFGTNDFRGTSGMGVPLGADSDDDGTTFKGAINYTIANILGAYPHIKIVFVTPLWRSRVSVSGDDSNVTPNGSGVYLREYAEAIKGRCAAYQLPVIDLHTNSGINILNWGAYMPDGLHPRTALGIRTVANTITGGLLAATW